jgi:hypothetical protein
MSVVRIANAGGFWGDWLEAPKRQVQGGKIDYLTIDYLAELTMSMLAQQKKNDQKRGFIYDFVRVCEELLPEIVEKGIKIVANAGGVNPKECGAAIRVLAKRLSLNDKVKIALVTGDDIYPRIKELTDKGEELKNFETGESFTTISAKLQSANVYVGSEGIAQALAGGANIVICGRVYDAALVTGPLRYEFGWKADDWDKLASAVVVGHILECGAQATGGNCSWDWRGIPDPANIGFPIAEVSASGKSVITKHPNTGGEVTTWTVKEQLLYEIGDPANYLTPDVVADFTTIELVQVGKDMVEVSGVKGKPAPDRLKASLSYNSGYRAEGTLMFSWPDALEKARLAESIVRERVSNLPLLDVISEFIGLSACHGSLGSTEQPEEVMLRMAVRGETRDAVQRFSRELPPLVLSGPPGIGGYAGERSGATEVFGFWGTLLNREHISLNVEYV